MDNFETEQSDNDYSASSENGASPVLEIELPYRFYIEDLPDLFEGRDPSKVTRLVITHSTYAEDDPDHLGPRESFSLPNTFTNLESLEIHSMFLGLIDLPGSS